MATPAAASQSKELSSREKRIWVGHSTVGWIIVIWVPGGHGRPYKVPKDVLAKDESNKRYYVRKFSSTVIASPDEERELFWAAQTIPFDDQPNLTSRVDALSRPLLREHLQEVGSSLYDISEQMETAEISHSMQLLAGSPEDVHPRSVGILMFSERIERYFPHARIEIMDLPDPTGEGMTERVFRGSIQHQFVSALSYIDSYVIQRRTFKHEGTPVAEVVTNYPYAAVEEILSNAVYHRSYQIPEPITVRVMPEAEAVSPAPMVVPRNLPRMRVVSRILLRLRTKARPSAGSAGPRTARTPAPPASPSAPRP